MSDSERSAAEFGEAMYQAGRSIEEIQELGPRATAARMHAYYVDASPGDMTRYQLCVFRTPAGWYVAWPVMDFLARWSPGANLVTRATGRRDGDGLAYDCKAIAAILEPLGATLRGVS